MIVDNHQEQLVLGSGYQKRPNKQFQDLEFFTANNNNNCSDVIPICNFLEFMIFRGVVLKELHADFFAYILGYFTPDKQFRVLICTKECRAHQYSHFRSASPHFVCWRTSKATETRTNLFYVETNPPKKYTTNFIMT